MCFVLDNICRLAHACSKSKWIITYAAFWRLFSFPFLLTYLRLVFSAAFCIVSLPSQWEEGGPAASACAALCFCSPAHTAAPAFFGVVDL